MDATLIYDADCGFCTSSAQWLAAKGTVGLQPWQGLQDLSTYGLDADMVTQAAFWVECDQVTGRGATAIAKALIHRGGAAAWAGRFFLLSGVNTVAHHMYGLIARHRHQMPGGTTACALPTDP